MITVVVLLLLAGGAYAMQNKKSSAPGSQTSNQSMGEAKEFAAAMQSGKPTTCTIAKDNNTMEYLLKNKKMRANITTKVEDKTTTSHMINDLAYLYMWQDGAGQGSKMAIPTEEETKAMADKAKQYQVENQTPKLDSEADYDGFKNQGYSINCVTGNIDDSMFTPPTSITFVDPTAMMKQVAPNGTTGKIDMEKLKELQKQYGGGAN